MSESGRFKLPQTHQIILIHSGSDTRNGWGRVIPRVRCSNHVNWVRLILPGESTNHSRHPSRRSGCSPRVICRFACGDSIILATCTATPVGCTGTYDGPSCRSCRQIRGFDPDFSQHDIPIPRPERYAHRHGVGTPASCGRTCHRVDTPRLWSGTRRLGWSGRLCRCRRRSRRRGGRCLR